MVENSAKGSTRSLWCPGGFKILCFLILFCVCLCNSFVLSSSVLFFDGYAPPGMVQVLLAMELLEWGVGWETTILLNSDMVLLGWHGLHKFHSRRRALAGILYQSQLLPCPVLLHWWVWWWLLSLKVIESQNGSGVLIPVCLAFFAPVITLQCLRIHDLEDLRCGWFFFLLVFVGNYMSSRTTNYAE